MSAQLSLEKYTTTYLITGATGYIGSQIVKKLVESEDYEKGTIKLILHCRNREKYESMYADVESDKIYHIVSDISDIKKVFEESKQVCYLGKVDYVIHCASNTTSSYMISNPVETMDGIVRGTRNVLELAKEMSVKGMVYLSSMEVYGDVNCTSENRATEDVLGFIDILKPRSSYPMGKRMAESYCAAYANEYGVPVKIARLAQTFGKGILPTENRSFAQFAKAAAEGRDIILKTAGKSIGNSVAIEEAVDAILFLLENGENGQAYNVVNEKNTMSIRDMAELVARELSGGKSKVVIDIEDASKTGYAMDTGLYMSGEKLRQLGWEAKKGLVDMYRDVIRCL